MTDWLVTVDTGSPYDNSHLVAARSASAARYASFRAWRDAGYGWRFHNAHEAFVWFSRNIVTGVRKARTPNPHHTRTGEDNG